MNEQDALTQIRLAMVGYSAIRCQTIRDILDTVEPSPPNLSPAERTAAAKVFRYYADDVERYGDANPPAVAMRRLAERIDAA